VDATERARLQERFLRAYKELGIIRAACHETSLDRSTIDWWRKHDARFEERFLAAREDSTDILRLEAYRRAVEGVEEPLVNGRGVVTRRVLAKDKDGMEIYGPDGKPVYVEVPMTVRRYSDGILLALLKARAEEFREPVHKHELTGRDGGAIEHNHRAVFLMPTITQDALDGWPEPEVIEGEVMPESLAALPEHVEARNE
jgi:hypothetical protein